MSWSLYRALISSPTATVIGLVNLLCDRAKLNYFYIVSLTDREQLLWVWVSRSAEYVECLGILARYTLILVNSYVPIGNVEHEYKAT